MPDREFDALVDGAIENRRARRRTLFGAWAMIVVMLAVLSYLGVGARADAHDASVRADRASRSACRLVGVVEDMAKLNNEGIAVLLAGPGDQRAQAIEALRSEVETQQAAATKAKNDADVKGC